MKKPIVLLAMATLGCEPKPLEIKTSALTSGTDALLQAISIVDDQTAWISGHKATFVRTTDAGNSWQVFRYELIDSLQFRDIHALSADEIVLMSAGPGAMSRIFKFHMDRGFEQTYLMEDSLGFLNTIEFWDHQTGLAFGDSFGGQLFVLKTTDGGNSWQRIDPTKLPAAGNGEGGFAASGTCISVRPGGKAWIATGAGGNARILFTPDFGESWQYFDTPMVKGDAAGTTSIHMLSDALGTIVGGDLMQADQHTSNTAVTRDGGKTWELTQLPNTKGAFYGSDLISMGDGHLWIACGPNGIDYSNDLGMSFQTLDTLNYWAVDLHQSGFGYASGTKGKILKIVF